ncbi:hypothetical protein OEZ71_09840 [Defluviimonas sp. WL0050]|uniref:Uncharacterized protein n=1 Tax=Albidovulum litorale TaxID=2984134 RepID=A0ABT2ZN91_9RHOB|nr:hypothetical protein [Defluviimonas sp. WL0050]MCV2872600.1 hypothetical protein [Defluviimonas sp. WL0050]
MSYNYRQEISSFGLIALAVIATANLYPTAIMSAELDGDPLDNYIFYFCFVDAPSETKQRDAGSLIFKYIGDEISMFPSGEKVTEIGSMLSWFERGRIFVLRDNELTVIDSDEVASGTCVDSTYTISNFLESLAKEDPEALIGLVSSSQSDSD